MRNPSVTFVGLVAWSQAWAGPYSMPAPPGGLTRAELGRLERLSERAAEAVEEVPLVDRGRLGPSTALLRSPRILDRNPELRLWVFANGQLSTLHELPPEDGATVILDQMAEMGGMAPVGAVAADYEDQLQRAFGDALRTMDGAEASRLLATIPAREDALTIAQRWDDETVVVDTPFGPAPMGPALVLSWTQRELSNPPAGWTTSTCPHCMGSDSGTIPANPRLGTDGPSGPSGDWHPSGIAVASSDRGEACPPGAGEDARWIDWLNDRVYRELETIGYLMAPSAQPTANTVFVVRRTKCAAPGTMESRFTVSNLIVHQRSALKATYTRGEVWVRLDLGGSLLTVVTDGEYGDASPWFVEMLDPIVASLGLTGWTVAGDSDPGMDTTVAAALRRRLLALL